MQSNHITPPAEMSSTQPVSQHSYILSALQGPMARPKFSTHADASTYGTSMLDRLSGLVCKRQ